MPSKWGLAACAGAALLITAGLVRFGAQDPPPDPNAPGIEQQTAEQQAAVSDPNCPYFGPERERFIAGMKAGQRQAALTADVVARLANFGQISDFGATANSMPSPPGGSRTDTFSRHSNTIDRYIFAALAQAGVAPAPPTTDWEFVRRVYLDLTGHVPPAAAALSFVQDNSPDKRARLVDSLIGSPEWVDKWTIWFGDFLQNNSRNSQIVRTISGVMAFNAYLRDSLTNGKPYDQMVRELISATGSNSYTQGEL